MKKDLIRKVAGGRISFHALEKHCSKEEAIEIRRKAIEKMSGSSLKHVGSYSIDLASVTGRNIDNPIGVVQVPVGVAGPVMVKGEYAKGRYPIFLATTEGALVASVNRGCLCINRAGGANVRILMDEMTRAPVFKAKNLESAISFKDWVRRHFKWIKKEAEKTTRHGKLLSITPFQLGRNVWLRFSYHTADASGLNMVTIATKKAVDFIERGQRFAKCVALSGNVCVDKKANALNFILGRGKTLVAEVFLPDEIVRKVLKCKPNDFVDVGYRKNLLGSIMSSSTGHNAHQANIIAASFIALGQDAAHTVDGSIGTTLVEREKGGIYVSVTIPALYVGTVGGGTRVETQKELLMAMGVKTGKELAEVVAVAVLAGEVSLMGALASGTLASAHAKLGR